MAAATSTDAWLVGAVVANTVLDHWDGNSWIRLSVLSVRKDLVSIIHVPGTTTYWAVGHILRVTSGGGYATPLIESHC